MTPEIISRIKTCIHEAEILDIIKSLVSSPSHPGVENQETGVANIIYDFFLKEGIPVEIIPVVDGRCNVIARLEGNGSGKTLLFTGHTDTVPPYDMAGNPYEVKIEDGKMFGRGVVDMKGALACMMSAMAAIKRSGIELSGDLLFAGVIDEEDKSEGTRALIKQGVKADGAIVGEPTEMEICIGHRGLEWIEFAFHGKTVHGGKQKDGINAIHKAVRFISKLEEELIPAIEKRTHPVSGHSSMNYGLIRGGTQPSTVAGECILQIDRRWVPGERYADIFKEYQQLLDQLHDEDPAFHAEFKVMEVSYMEDGYIHEAMETDAEDPLVKISKAAIMATTEIDTMLQSFTAWTDGGLINSYCKVPTIILGPGNLESAHSAYEYLDVDAIVPATIIYALIACEYCK